MVGRSEAELSAVDVNEMLDRSLFIAMPDPAKSSVRVHRHYREKLPKVIGDILGHQRPESTSAYIRIATEGLRGLALAVPK